MALGEKRTFKGEFNYVATVDPVTKRVVKEEFEKWSDGRYVPHRDLGPARISEDRTFGRLTVNSGWYRNGRPHREGGPAQYGVSDTGFVYGESWYLNGELHRADGPARISRREALFERHRAAANSDDIPFPGVVHMAWYIAGQLHRVDGPAALEFYDDGSLRRETWSINGERHRVGGPAVTHYTRAGKPFLVSYFQHDLLHRPDGPAYIRNGKDGAPPTLKYFLRGVKQAGLAPTCEP